jgi:hypothetical protein
MPSALSTSEPVTSESTDSAATRPTTDIAADAVVVLAALGRIQDAAYSDRATIEHLREALGTLADDIARAKATLFAAADAEAKPDMSALLDQFEHQVDAMLETAGGKPSAAPAVPAAKSAALVMPETPAVVAESDEVPTVSGVVSGLGGDEPSAVEAPLLDGAPDQVTSVALLKAMVAALNASVPPPTTPQPPAPKSADATPPLTEPLLDASESRSASAEPARLATEGLGTSEVLFAAAARPQPDDPLPVAAEIHQQPTEPAPAEIWETLAEPASPTAPAVIPMHELLDSYQRMEARPIPPPDEGTAVIFSPRPELPAQAQPIVAAETIATLKPATLPAAAPAAAVEAAPSATGAGDTFEVSPAVADAVHASVESLQAVVSALPAAAEATSAELAAAPPTDTDFDPADLLFGPEPEPDPAAFLLEPSSPEPMTEPQPTASAPRGTPTSAAAPFAGPADQPPDGGLAEPAALPAPAKPDPLAPLKAMSEAERIAIFS